jgi:hypothetical protein
MPHPPAHCPDCKSIFPARAISISNASSIGLSNIITDCPVCGSGNARVSDGVYSATHEAIELISGPASSREHLEALRALAQLYSAGKITREDATQKAGELPPEYAKLFNLFTALGMPALALLVSLVSAYLQWDSNRSSGEDAKKLLQAVTEQTFTLKEAQQQSVKQKRAAPAAKKANVKPPSIKNPSIRRRDVNRERRASIKRNREQFGKPRSS